MDKHNYTPARNFHGSGQSIYKRKLGPAVCKEDALMAKVLYEPAHENPDESGNARRGSGRAFVKWIFSEEPETAEDLINGNLAFLHDTVLEAKASVGLHLHEDAGEIYYLLEGSLTITTVDEEGREWQQTLAPGDAHLLKPGQAHCAEAGQEGARFIVVGLQ